MSELESCQPWVRWCLTHHLGYLPLILTVVLMTVMFPFVALYEGAKAVGPSMLDEVRLAKRLARDPA